MSNTGALAAFLLLGSAALPCSASTGASPFEFLRADPSARAVSMGGAYTALSADAYALHYNPAGLAWIARREASFTHDQHAEGALQEFAGYADPRGWGLDFNYLDFGGVQRTSISNPDGLNLGETGLTDLAFAGGYGRRLTGDFAIGAAIRLIREDIDGTKARAAAINLGALYAVPALGGLSFGAAVRNAGPSVRFQNASENLPLELALGGAYVFDLGAHRQTVSLDLDKKRGAGMDAGVGFESFIAPPLAVRVGYSTENDAGPGVAAGVGWVYQDLRIDYAFITYGKLGDSHRLTFTLRFGPAEAAARH